MCVVIQTIPSTALCDRQPPLIQMILPFLFLLASLLQQYGSEAESSHTSKFHLPSIKEQNGVQDSHQEKIITVSGEGMVHSPDFPHTYPRNTALTWRLVAPSNMKIQLTFDERFGLEDPEDGICKYDFVEIEDLPEKAILGRWCGSQSVPTSRTSEGNQIRIRFVSDEYFPSEPGFCIRYSLLSVIQLDESDRRGLSVSLMVLLETEMEKISGFTFTKRSSDPKGDPFMPQK